MIDGVSLIPLATHPDERGFFREVARASRLPQVPVQLSHSFMHAGVVKAWHVHRRQWDWWYVVSGRLKVALYDARFGDECPVESSMLDNRAIQWRRVTGDLPRSDTSGVLQEFILGDEPALLCIPPGVAHGCKALTDTHLVYLTSNEYDGTDEGRLAHDDPVIGYDWTKGAEIK